MATVTLRLTIADPVPGMLYSLQDKRSAPVRAVRADDAPLSLDVPVTLASDGRLTGQYVRREGPERRFVYVAIGQQAGDGAACINRRAKIDIHDVPPALLRPDAVLAVTLPGRDAKGLPACATVRPIKGWRAVQAPAG